MIVKGVTIVYFYDKKLNEKHTGVLLNNNKIICLCCGGVVEPSEYTILMNNRGFAYVDDILKQEFGLE